MMLLDQLQFIEKCRAEGKTWKEVAKLYEQEYGESLTGNAIQKRYAARTDADGKIMDSKDLAKILRSQVAARKANKEKKKALEAQILLEDVLRELKKIPLNLKKVTLPKPKKSSKITEKMTVEANFGDLQVGKIMDDYNSDVAERRVEEYTKALIMKIKMQEKLGYEIDKIAFNLLGDIIEHSEKHHNSQRATDSSTPEQMRRFVEIFYKYVMIPLASQGYKVDFHCVTGNHENANGGLEMFYPGREHLSWTMYNYLKMLAEASGMKNFTFNIAEGAFLHYDIYGETVLIEHGVKVSATEAAMVARVQQRSRQIKKHISYFRVGDKHHVARFNNDAYVINGAFFGADERGVEYSGISGYYAPAAQVVFFHVPRKKDDPRKTIFDSFVIQLQHVR